MDTAPTEKMVTAESIPAAILVLKLRFFVFVVFIVFTPFVVVVLFVLLLTVLVLRWNKFFIVISPFNCHYEERKRRGNLNRFSLSLYCDYSISGRSLQVLCRFSSFLQKVLFF